MDSYHSGLLSTSNIQVSGKIFSDEIINFPVEIIADLTFDSSTFKNSHFINMKFINVNFENNILRSAEYDNCVFSNCFLIDCNLNESNFTETIFKDLEGGSLGSAVLIDSKFSNSKKSIEFEGNVYFNDILNQINKLYLD